MTRLEAAHAFVVVLARELVAAKLSGDARLPERLTLFTDAVDRLNELEGVVQASAILRPSLIAHQGTGHRANECEQCTSARKCDVGQRADLRAAIEDLGMLQHFVNGPELPCSRERSAGVSVSCIARLEAPYGRMLTPAEYDRTCEACLCHWHLASATNNLYANLYAIERAR